MNKTVSTDVYLPDDIIIIDSNDSGVNTSATVAQSPANMSFKALELAVQLSEAVRNSDINVIANLKTQLDSTIGNIKQIQVQSQKLSQKYLEKLVNTKDKTEYKNLLKSFTKQKEINTRARQQIKRIEYAAQNNDYENLINELKNYQSNFDDIIKKNQSKRPLNIGKLAPINIYNSTSVSSPYMNNYVPENELSPLVSKKIIDTSTLLGHASNILHNSYEFWKASSYNFTRSKDYIEKNGNLIHSVSELPTKELQQIVSNKLKQQIGKKDTIGVIFQPDSSISNAISNSETIKEYFQEHANQLLKGQVVKIGSKRFNWDENFDLFATYGYADILYAHISSNGDFYAIVFDTYDFNKGENIIIDMAKTVQDANLAQKYYTLSIVIIPMIKWQKWMK